MGKVGEVRQLLNEIGMPDKQQTDLCCYVLLTMANVKETDAWKSATNEWIRIHDIIQFLKDNYGVIYAENSLETIRKKVLHHFRRAALIEDNEEATNSPNYKYRLTVEVLAVLQSLGGRKADATIKGFITCHEKLIKTYASKKEMTKIPVKINNKEFTFSKNLPRDLLLIQNVFMWVIP